MLVTIPRTTSTMALMVSFRRAAVSAAGARSPRRSAARHRSAPPARARAVQRRGRATRRGDRAAVSATNRARLAVCREAEASAETPSGCKWPTHHRSARPLRPHAPSRRAPGCSSEHPAAVCPGRRMRQARLWSQAFQIPAPGLAVARERAEQNPRPAHAASSEQQLVRPGGPGRPDRPLGCNLVSSRPREWPHVHLRRAGFVGGIRHESTVGRPRAGDLRRGHPVAQRLRRRRGFLRGRQARRAHRRRCRSSTVSRAQSYRFPRTSVDGVSVCTNSVDAKPASDSHCR